MIHPRDALFDEDDGPGAGVAGPAGPGAPRRPPLPVCDHYAGVESRMRKSLELQAELGPVFDVTLDCEDGAPVGGEAEHARLVAEMAMSPANVHGRVGVRVHPVDHRSFADDVDTLVGRAGTRLAYLMLPKPRGAADVTRAVAHVDHALRVAGLDPARLPVHVLVETHGALREVDAIAAHPRVESLSFGLMDFVSAHRGAIPAEAMTAAGQFSHPLVLRAKLEIAAACHAHGKTPSHCVVTEFKDSRALADAARRAGRELGYTRMWSIHPDQIRTIVDAFAPAPREIDEAVELLAAAQRADWAPIRHAAGGSGEPRLHDRASYRHFWQLLERARRTGRALPAEAEHAWFDRDTHVDGERTDNPTVDNRRRPDSPR